VRTSEDRICENCGREYWATNRTMRWCSPWCREEYRNAELRAARRMWAELGRPKAILEECRETEAQR
jgi:hypothetical protein